MTWEFGAKIHPLKLQCLKNRVLHTNGNISRRTLVRDLHMAFQIPYVYDYVTKLCRQQADVVQDNEIKIFATLDKAKPDKENIRGLNLVAVRCRLTRPLIKEGALLGQEHNCQSYKHLVMNTYCPPVVR
jgi:hypothetical protein